MKVDSSNTSLVPSGGIALAGTSARTLTLTPALNQFGTTTITVAATDGDGDTTQRSFVFTVRPVNDAPILAAADSVTLNELVALAFTASASDVDTTDSRAFSLDAGAPSGAAINSTTGQFSWAPTEAQGPGVFPITVRVTDNGTPSLSATRSFTVTVNEVNSVPVLSAIGDQSINESNALTLTATASDSDLPANTLAFSLDAGAPSGAAINSTTGQFSWTPTEAQGPGVFPITVRVTDNGTPSLNATRSFTVTVNEVNSAPTLAAIAGQTVNEGNLLSFTATGSDTDIPGNTLSYTIENGPTGMAINGSTGLITWTPTESQGPGSVTVTVRVTDNGSPALSGTTSVTVQVNEVNSAPTLATVSNQTIAEGSTLTVTAVAIDPDLPANTLTFSLGPNAPAGAAIHPATGVLTWTPTEAQGPSTNPMTILVTDNGASPLSASQTFTVTVTEVNLAPTLAPVAGQTVAEGSLLTVNLVASDADVPPGALTFSLGTGAPAGVSINATSGVLTWTPTEAQGPGASLITVTVTDDGSPRLSASQSFQITVTEVNAAPVLEAIGDQTVAEGQVVKVTARATDSDLPANSLIFSLGTGAPSGAAIDPSTGELTWTTPKNPTNATNVISVVVTDNGTPSLTAQQSFRVIVTAVNDAPVIAAPATKQIDEDTALTLNDVSVTDPDAGVGQLRATVEAGQGTLSLNAPSGLVFNVAQNGTARLEFEGTLTALGNAFTALTYRPATNYAGADTISITVNDQGNTGSGGALSHRKEIRVTVTPVNDSPMISAVSAQRTVESTTVGPIAFAVGDVESSPSALKVSGVSSSPGLIGTAGLEFNGVGTDRTIRVTPVPGQVGQAEIRLTVEDAEGAQASTTFVVTVTPAAPKIVTAASDKAVLVGTAVRFEAQVSGTAPLTFQWLFNGAAIAGATNAAHPIASARVVDTGVYTLRVTNAAGTVEQAMGTLEVRAELGLGTDLTDQTVKAGSTVEFKAVAAGTAPFTYQWRFNGAALAGETRDQLVLANVSSSQAGLYSVDIENSAGRVSSRLAKLQVLVSPAISSQPLNQQTASGETATFLVVATGTEPLVYQWRFNGQPLSGANQSSLVLERAGSSQAGRYDVSVKNAAGEAISQAAQLTIVEQVAITQDVSDQSALVGQTATLRVESTGADPRQFQWYFNDAPISGATNVVLTLVNIQPDRAGIYWIEVSNAANRARSRKATLSILALPSISQDPKSQAVREGERATMSVVASGSEPLGYQWQFNGADLAGATTPVLVIESVAKSQGGSYQVRVRNAAGELTSAKATLTVLLPVKLDTQSKEIIVNRGERVTMEVKATGSEPLIYEWYYEGSRLAAAADSRLVLDAAALTDAGRYSVVVRNPAGVFVGPEFRVTVIDPIRIVRQPADQVAKQGDRVVFSVGVEGTGPFRYSWTKGGATFRDTSEPTLTLPGVQVNAEGRYGVRVSNATASATSADASLRVIGLPTLKPLPKELKVQRGSDVTLQAEPSGEGPFTYQWLRNGVNIEGAAGSSFTIPNIQVVDGSTYTVVATGAGGAITADVCNVIVITPSYPLSDNLSNVVISEATGGEFSGNNIGSTAEANEPAHGVGQTAKSSVWLAWKAPGNGIATFDTIGSGFDTLVTIHSGPKDKLVPIAIDDDSGGFLTSRVSFNAVKDEVYYVAIDGFQGVEGQIITHWKFEETAEPLPVIVKEPANLTVLVGAPGSLAVEAQSKTGAALLYQWYRDGAPVAGATSATFSVASAKSGDVGSYRVKVRHSGNSREAESAPAIFQVNFLESGLEGAVVEAIDKFDAVSQTGEQVVVPRSQPPGSGGAASPGDSRLTVKSIVSRRPLSQLSGYRGFKAFSNRSSTKDAGEPNHAHLAGGASVWFTYTGVTNALMRVSTEGSDFDTVLAVYTGLTQDYTKLVELTYDNNSGADGRSSVVLFAVEKAKNYYVVVDGVNGARGIVNFKYEIAAPPVVAKPAAWSLFNSATGQPVGQANNPRVGIGESVRFVVEAINPLAPVDLSFQWRRSGLDLPAATNAVLVLSNLSSQNAGDYTVEVSNFAGRAASSPVTFGVNEPIRVLSELRDRIVVAGQTVTFAVAASGSGPLVYRWTRNGVELPGETGSSITLANVSAGQAGQYVVELSNSAGKVTSRATLFVSEPPSLPTLPPGQTVGAGSTVTISVSASGTAPLAYQWRLNGVPLAGATSSALSVASIQTSQAGSYTVVISNAAGSITSGSIAVVVRVPLAITRQPVSQLAVSGDSKAFDVVAVGTGALTYQWRLNGRNVAGATGATLRLTNVQREQAGIYQVQVADAEGSVASEEALLAIKVAPAIVKQPQGQSVLSGDSLALSVEATGAVLRYQWRLDGVDLVGANNATLNLAKAALADAGTYTVMVQNDVGIELSQAAVVTVQERVRLTAQPDDLTSCLGESVRLTVQADGALPLRYQWSFKGEVLPGATNAVLTLTNLQAIHGGSYQVVVTNAVSVAQSRPALLTILSDSTLRIVSVRRLGEQGSHLMMTGPVGQLVYLQGSADLARWTVLTNFTFTSNCHEYVDVSSGVLDRRYYKIAPPPLRILKTTRSGQGQIGFEVDGQAGLKCLIRVSDDLITWTDLTTVTIQNGKLDFSDPQAAGLDHRYYQAIVQP